MPDHNGTGPRGLGPMTGRCLGYCAINRGRTTDDVRITGFTGKYGIPVILSNHLTYLNKEVTMPFGDGTGPMGMGPMSGRAAGYCSGYGAPGYMNRWYGRGGGFGRGGGRGHRHWFYATGLTGWQRAQMYYPPYAPQVPYAGAWNREQEMEYLKAQAENMQNALEEIRKRIEDLAAQAEDKK
ncbi:DUF5320 domain-containing protein [candidate division KSB1 bacterium]|nr:DUF5320 domain-containing protein [candidate division KSB1 bacterium]